MENTVSHFSTWYNHKKTPSMSALPPSGRNYGGETSSEGFVSVHEGDSVSLRGGGGLQERIQQQDE